jgi:hypothetical protein
MDSIPKSEIRQKTSTGEVRIMKRIMGSRSGDGTIVAIVAALLIVLAIVAIVILVPVKTLTFDQTKTVEKKQGVNTLELTLNADIAEVHLYYEDLANSSIEVRVQAKAQVGMLDQSTNIMKFTMQSSVSGNKLLVSVITDLADWLALGPWTKVNVTAVMDKSLFDYASVNTGTGSLWLNAGEGAHVNATSLRTTTGDATVKMGAGVQLGGSMSIATTTGTITTKIDDIEVKDNVTISMQDTTGSINTEVVQMGHQEHNLSVQMSAITGSMSYTVEIAGTNGGAISATTNIGSVHISRSDNFSSSSSGQTTNMQSISYPGYGNVIAVLSGNLGSITLSAAYEVTEAGDLDLQLD